MATASIEPAIAEAVSHHVQYLPVLIVIVGGQIAPKNSTANIAANTKLVATLVHANFLGCFASCVVSSRASLLISPEGACACAQQARQAATAAPNDTAARHMSMVHSAAMLGMFGSQYGPQYIPLCVERMAVAAATSTQPIENREQLTVDCGSNSRHGARMSWQH